MKDLPIKFAVWDYLAGMTDNYIIEKYASLTFKHVEIGYKEYSITLETILKNRNFDPRPHSVTLSRTHLQSISVVPPAVTATTAILCIRVPFSSERFDIFDMLELFASASAQDGISELSER